jgi:hypothetical protein
VLGIEVNKKGVLTVHNPEIDKHVQLDKSTDLFGLQIVQGERREYVHRCRPLSEMQIQCSHQIRFELLPNVGVEDVVRMIKDVGGDALPDHLEHQFVGEMIGVDQSLEDLD